jgi:hypothetical protein
LDQEAVVSPLAEETVSLAGVSTQTSTGPLPLEVAGPSPGTDDAGLFDVAHDPQDVTLAAH